MRRQALTALSGARATGVGRDACLGPSEMAPRGRKKQRDPLLVKEWYATKAPSMLGVRSRGKTFVSRTHGTEIASEEIKGLVMELNLMDLNPGVKQSFGKIKLFVDDVQGCNDLMDRCPERGKTMLRAGRRAQTRRQFGFGGHGRRNGRGDRCSRDAILGAQREGHPRPKGHDKDGDAQGKP